MTERGYKVAQRDFDISKRGTAWFKRGTRAGILKIPAVYVNKSPIYIYSIH